MTGCIDLLDEIHDIAPVSVSFHAGNDVLASKQGTIRLTSQISLKNVYLVDGFHII